MEIIAVQLEGEARKISNEIIINRKPTYEYWKKLMKESTVTKAERNLALHAIYKSKYNFRNSPERYLKDFEKAIKIVRPEISSESIAMLILHTIPEPYQDRLLTKGCALNLSDLKSAITEIYLEINKPFQQLRNPQSYQNQRFGQSQFQYTQNGYGQRNQKVMFAINIKVKIITLIKIKLIKYSQIKYNQIL